MARGLARGRRPVDVDGIRAIKRSGDDRGMPPPHCSNRRLCHCAASGPGGLCPAGDRHRRGAGDVRRGRRLPSCPGCPGCSWSGLSAHLRDMRSRRPCGRFATGPACGASGRVIIALRLPHFGHALFRIAPAAAVAGAAGGLNASAFVLSRPGCTWHSYPFEVNR